MDLSYIQPRLVTLGLDVQSRPDQRGLFNDLTTVDLGVLHWSGALDDSLACAIRFDAGARARVVYFRAGDFEAEAGTLSLALSAPLTDVRSIVTLGEAEALHERLVLQADAALRMSTCAAARTGRWRHARIHHSPGRALLVHGEAEREARLEIRSTRSAVVQLTGTLAGCVLFSIGASLEDAPHAAVLAVRALEDGARLHESEAVRAQRDAHETIVAQLRLATPEVCPACHSAEAPAQAHEGGPDGSLN